MSIGKVIRIIIALTVIVGVTYWAVNSVRERSYTGSRLSFEVGAGHVTVNNLGQDIIPVEMRSGQGSTTSFRIASTDLDLNVASKRQGSGRSAYQMVPIELPPGQAMIDVTRGNNVQFVATGTGQIQATVTPMSPESARNTIIFAVVVVLVAIYYLSAVLEHRWVHNLLAKLPKRGQSTKRAAA